MSEMSEMSKLTQLSLLMFTSQEMHNIIENEVNFYDPNDHIHMFSTKKWIEITENGRGYLNTGEDKETKKKSTIFSPSQNPSQKLRDKITQLQPTITSKGSKKGSQSNKKESKKAYPKKKK